MDRECQRYVGKSEGVAVLCTNNAEQEAHVEQLLGRQPLLLVVRIMMYVTGLLLFGQDVRFE